MRGAMLLQELAIVALQVELSRTRGRHADVQRDSSTERLRVIWLSWAQSGIKRLTSYAMSIAVPLFEQVKGADDELAHHMGKPCPTCD